MLHLLDDLPLQRIAEQFVILERIAIPDSCMTRVRSSAPPTSASLRMASSDNMSSVAKVIIFLHILLYLFLLLAA